MNKQLMALQLELEADMHGSGIMRFEGNNQRAIDSGNASETEYNRRLVREFIKPMAEGIEAYITYYTGRRGVPVRALEFINQVEPEQAAYITIRHILDVLDNSKFEANYTVTKLGRYVEDQVRFTRLDTAAPKYVQKIKDSLKKRASTDYDHKHKVMVNTEKKLVEKGGDFVVPLERWVEWREEDCKHIGAALINIFEKSVVFHDGEPLIERQIRNTHKGPIVYLCSRPAVTDWITKYKNVIGCMSPAYAPCVVAPRDWTSPTEGGYHTIEVASTLPLVKTRKRSVLKRMTPEQMPEVYSAVNTLQGVRWQVSKEVLAVANELVTLGLPFALPQREPLKVPPCPLPEYTEGMKGATLAAVLTADELAEFNEWKTDARIVYEKEGKRKAEFNEVIRTLQQGNKYSQFHGFHFVYTLDFRGRVYCQGSLISPQGGDLQKSLIKFADGMALGPAGLYWFAVHGANEWGWDKKTFPERYENVMTDEFKQMCKDIVADPITFNDWVRADKPWQFLNWCYEFVSLLKHTEGGEAADTFVSYIPVAMDGSCSGIQHYSAMLRDSVGGAAVNLVPDTFVKDIYGAVAQVVIDTLNRIVEGGESVGKLDEDVQVSIANEWLRIGITRNLTKKPVMTLPYGSTQMTCREHVSSYLVDLQDKEYKLAKSERRKASKVHYFQDTKGSDLNLKDAEVFISGIIWKAIGEVVIAARAAMRYLKQVTTIVAKQNLPLEWVTPTGFIVHQAIYQTKQWQVRTQMLGETRFVTQERTKQIDYHRMVNSCAPNFVHSMDASHLIKATNAFKGAGINSIAVIHDSFGTHAGNTDSLRKLLKGAMVDMYNEHDVIAEFAEYLECKHLIEIDKAQPAKGKLDLEQLRKSTYAFA